MIVQNRDEIKHLCTFVAPRFALWETVNSKQSRRQPSLVFFILFYFYFIAHLRTPVNNSRTMLSRCFKMSSVHVSTNLHRTFILFYAYEQNP